jgi:oligopeptide/dipeptide ABC transporter ATP-binding protein
MNSSLTVKNLRTYFFVDEGIVKAVDGVDLTVGEGETVGVIGESGCGKSVMARSLLRLVVPPGEIVDGSALLRRKDGSQVDIFSAPPSAGVLREIRGNEMSMVFQEPMTAFSPVHTVGFQISEMVAAHSKMPRKECREYVIDLLRRVGISNPAQRYDEYTYQLSGGMRQRAMIAMAISCSPKIIIADEPTTALDVTIQAQILDLMEELRQQNDMALVYITHDLGLVAENVDRVYVMYLGRVVEVGATRDIFVNPLHPYTQKLLQAVPRLGERQERLAAIEGTVPSALNPPAQCPFFSRCDKAMPGTCDRAIPALTTQAGREVRCFLYSQEQEATNDWQF